MVHTCESAACCCVVPTALPLSAISRCHPPSNLTIRIMGGRVSYISCHIYRTKTTLTGYFFEPLSWFARFQSPTFEFLHVIYTRNEARNLPCEITVSRAVGPASSLLSLCGRARPSMLVLLSSTRTNGRLGPTNRLTPIVLLFGVGRLSGMVFSPAGTQTR